MKDKRNCANNMNYPVYHPQMMVPPMGYPAYPMQGYQQNFNTSNMGNTFEQQLSNLEQQINLLDQRITRLEKLNANTTNNFNKYSDSNYYMV